MPDCPNLAGYGLRVCERHLHEPAARKDRAEALAYLRGRLIRYEQVWPRLDMADSLDLQGRRSSGSPGQGARLSQ